MQLKRVRAIYSGRRTLSPCSIGVVMMMAAITLLLRRGSGTSAMTPYHNFHPTIYGDNISIDDVAIQFCRIAAAAAKALAEMLTQAVTTVHQHQGQARSASIN